MGLVHQPFVKEFTSFESRRTGLKEQGCFPGSEAVSFQVQFAATPRILHYFLSREEGGPEGGGGGGTGERGGGRGRGVARREQKGGLVEMLRLDGHPPWGRGWDCPQRDGARVEGVF